MGEKIWRKAIITSVFISMLMLHFCTIAGAQTSQTFSEKQNAHPKLESVLAGLEKEHKKGEVYAQFFAAERDLKIEDKDNITVFLLFKDAGAIDIDELNVYGVEVIKCADNVMKARVPIMRLGEIADSVEGISFVKLPDKPIPLVTSEGVSLTGAPAFHFAGYDGAGAKVAIIDLGFAGLSSAISAGELPSSIISIDCTGSGCMSTPFPFETESHGTAVAEIVHDMAPGAQLYLIKVSDPLDLVDAKNFCISNGIGIINHSVGYVNQNFYDGACYNSNPVCTTDDAFANGILWINAAGNEAQRHYEATFSDSNGNAVHDQLISISAIVGESISAYLTWNAWPATDQDYDLILLDSSLNMILFSANSQTGSQPPIEGISVTAPYTGTYYLAINKYSATSNHNLELYSFANNFNPAVLSSSLLCPADAKGAMAVGAIDYWYWTTGPIANYSSQGLTNDGRIKPDISGPASVSTYTYGINAFSGTSAAAPHVAGAAALILSNNPSYSVSQLWNALTDSAIDIGAIGQDYIYGFGILNMSPIGSESISTPYMPGGPSTGLTGISYAYLAGGSFSNVGHEVQYLFDWGDGTNSGWLPPGLTSASHLWNLPGDYLVKVRARCAVHNAVLSSWSSAITIDITASIALQSPPSNIQLSACSLYSPAIFSWNPAETFTKIEVQFSADSSFGLIPVKVKVSGTATQTIIKVNLLKKILLIPGAAGGTVYWRAVGVRADKTVVSSSAYPIGTDLPHGVGTPSISPTSKAILPVLSWENNCNTKFKVWFGNDPDFSKPDIRKKALTFNLKNPTGNEGLFARLLTSGKWTAVKNLVENVSGSTIYWFVESWDGLKRYDRTDVMNFILLD